MYALSCIPSVAIVGREQGVWLGHPLRLPVPYMVITTMNICTIAGQGGAADTLSYLNGMMSGQGQFKGPWTAHHEGPGNW